MLKDLDGNPLSTHVNRRDVLRIGGAAAAAGALSIRSVGAQDATPGAPAASPAADTGMSPSPIPGVPDAYWRYPDPYTTVTAPPGKGGTIRITFLSEAQVKGHDDNAFWQELEKRIGASLDITLVPGAGYPERMATMAAGGDFPDLLYLLPLLYPQLEEFMIQGAFADVTQYLDGDAKSAFPNLALFPEHSWTNSKINGVLWGVPNPTSLNANALWYRSDWLDASGLAVPTNAAEFLEMLQRFTDSDLDGSGSQDTFGTAFERLDAVSQRFINGMYHVPAQANVAEGYDWTVNPDGSFTNMIETPEFRQALEFERQVWAAGVCHPDSLTQTSNEVREQLIAGTVGSGPNAFILLPLIRREAAKINPDARVMGLIPPGHDGGEGVAYKIRGFFGSWALPASLTGDDARIEELLGVTNYFGAPFGSEEYIFLNFGLEGIHHTVNDDGSRTLTQQGTEEHFNLSLGGLNVLYSPNQEEITYVQSLMAEQVRIGITPATIGLYSPTAKAEASVLTQLFSDRKIEIATGRADMSALDQWIEDWASRGGEQIRTEFEEAYAAAHG